MNSTLPSPEPFDRKETDETPETSELFLDLRGPVGPMRGVASLTVARILDRINGTNNILVRPPA